MNNQSDIAKSQFISIANQWGRSIIDREKSKPAFSTESFIAIEYGADAVTMDMSTVAEPFLDSELLTVSQDLGGELTKCVRHTIGRTG